MAEEIDIRSVWKSSKENTATPDVPFQEGKKAKTTLYWIKFILWIEFWLSIVCVGPMVYYFTSNDQFGQAAFYGAITIIYLFYYQFLIKKINAFHYDGNVVESLKKVYGYLRFYLLHYKVVIWLSLIFGVFFGMSDPENAKGLANLSTTKQWTIFISVVLTMILLLGGIMHGLVHLIYGRKIRRLKETVRDLESQE